MPTVSWSWWPDRSTLCLLYSPVVACALCLQYRYRADQIRAHIAHCTHRLLPALYVWGIMVECTSPARRLVLIGYYLPAMHVVLWSYWLDRSAYRPSYWPTVTCALYPLYSPAVSCALYLRYHGHAGQIRAHKLWLVLLTGCCVCARVRYVHCIHRLLHARYICSTMVVLTR